VIPVDVACGVAVSVHAFRFYVADLAVGNGSFGVHGLGRERKVDDYLQLLAVRLCFFYFDGRHGGCYACGSCFNRDSAMARRDSVSARRDFNTSTSSRVSAMAV